MSVVDVLCIGDLDVDMFISVAAIPGFDQKIAGQNHGRKPGGMSANCAVAVSRLGLRSRLIAAVGSDEAGAFAVQEIGRDGVDLDFLVHRPGVDTFMCVVLLSPSGEKSLIKLETAAYMPDPADLDPAAFEGVRHMHITFGSPLLSLATLRMASERGITTSLDLEPPDIARNPHLLSAILPMVDTLFLNREAYGDANRVLGTALAPRHLRRGGEIVVTLGADGCRRIAAEATIDMPGFLVEPTDTTGAGDCFAGAYLVARLSGGTPAQGLEFANAAAALATLQFGAQSGMPFKADVEAFVARHRAPQTDESAVIKGIVHA